MFKIEQVRARTPPQSDRNLTIFCAAMRGGSYNKLALEHQVTHGRIKQICRKVVHQIERWEGMQRPVGKCGFNIEEYRAEAGEWLARAEALQHLSEKPPV